MSIFCHRLVIRDGKIISVHSTDSKNNLLELCSPEVANEAAFNKDGWFVKLIPYVDLPCRHIDVEYSGEEKIHVGHLDYVDSGDLFLLLPTNGRPQMDFYYRDLSSTMMRLFGIKKIVYQDINDTTQEMSWKDLNDKGGLYLSWLFTDGVALPHLACVCDENTALTGFGDVDLNGEEDNLLFAVSDATWAVTATLNREDKKGGFYTYATLFVKDEAAAIAAIPKLHEYLETYECHNFCELLYSRLP